MELWRYRSTGSRSPVAGRREQIIPPLFHTLLGTGFSSLFSYNLNSSKCVYWISAQFRCIFQSLNVVYTKKKCTARIKSIINTAVVVNKSLLINLFESRLHFGLNKRKAENKKEQQQRMALPVIYFGFSQRCTLCMIMWGISGVFSSAERCYQKMDPPMEHFKVKAMPRLQLLTCKTASLFRERHCWATRD